MNNEKYNQIIGNAWDNYQKKVLDKFMSDTTIAKYTITNKEEFINKCKTDDEFSKKWELKIEERELTLEERLWLFINRNNGSHPEDIEVMDDYEIPTKLITITYNNIKTEIYG